jgi:glycogen debranching enzyme
MHRFAFAAGIAGAFLIAASSAIESQQPFPALSPIQAFPFDNTLPVIQAHSEPLKPFTVAGERGVLLGQQDGTLESWVLPVKLLSHLTIEADIQGYGVPIDVNRESAEIEVRPDRTVITYSHPTFTVRQIMFSADGGPAGTGPVILFQFDCLHPTDFTFQFTPELRWMWPQRNEGTPGADWVPGFDDGKVLPGGSGGYYVIGADYPDLAAAVTIPGARPGIMAPYQERPQVHPIELKLHIDPSQDHDHLYPLLMAVGTSPSSSTPQALGATLTQLNAGIAATCAAHGNAYKKLLANSVSIDTPDKSLNEAFQWAVVSIEQLKARAYDPHSTDPAGELGLVAGYYTSADSARPGFGWFFGRDALYTLYAVNGYGDFALSKAELEFLIRRQRADGKIMHEYSQTASVVDWAAFPYEYAAADSTPLFLMAVADYVRSSGDVAFLTAHRDVIEKAWAFETDPAHDTDHDGIYDNSQGTGWVEGWPGALPHQEIYLALLDQQASDAMGWIETQFGGGDKAAAAKKRAATVAKTIETEYYDAEKGCYDFSRDVAKDGSISMDRTKTVYPALAWWDPGTSNGQSILAHPEGCLRQLAAHALNTDWGLRDVANDEKIYDGLSYHQGSVWPLFTGWAAMAEYRGGQPLAGYQLLMENANLTRAQDLGAITELLSGDFFVPFGRSTSHQLWSSAMVITPILRGLFGISIDAERKTITVNPRLPAGWNHATVKDLRLPGGEETLTFERKGQKLIVSVSDWHKAGWKVLSDEPGSQSGKLESGFQGSEISLPALEIADGRGVYVRNSAESVQSGDWRQSPWPGSRTEFLRVISEHWTDHQATLTIEGPAGATGSYFILRHTLLPHLQIKCPDIDVHGPNSYTLRVPCTFMIDSGNRDPNVPIRMTPQLPSGEGWKTITVTLTW